MPLPIVIVHGWSDHSASFLPLQKALVEKLGVSVTTISLADWESMDDCVDYDDIVTRMNEAWTAKGLPTGAAQVDVIVHSTGALIVRDWLTRFFNSSASPIKHLLFLAPANFGSPLAHKGTSFIGRVIKGWSSDKMFEVGELVLKGLELASDYTWKLAMKDLFGPTKYYGTGAILGTVIVGNTGYTGISAAANEPGSDGTVRVSTANLDPVYVEADLSDPTSMTCSIKEVPSDGRRVGFCLVDGISHSQAHDPSLPAVLKAILDALAIDDAGFEAYCDLLDQASTAILTRREQADDAYYWGYQNTVFLVTDQYDRHIKDYFIEFFDEKDESFWDDLFHRKIIQDVHPYSNDNGYRSLLIDVKTLHAAAAANPDKVPKMSLTASPEFTTNLAGYPSFNDTDIGAIRFDGDLLKRFFQPNRTVLVHLKVRREGNPKVFGFS